MPIANPIGVSTATAIAMRHEVARGQMEGIARGVSTPKTNSTTGASMIGAARATPDGPAGDGEAADSAREEKREEDDDEAEGGVAEHDRESFELRDLDEDVTQTDGGKEDRIRGGDGTLLGMAPADDHDAGDTREDDD